MKKNLFLVLFLTFCIPILCISPYGEAVRSFPLDYKNQTEITSKENAINLKFLSLDIEKIKGERIERFEGEKYFLLTSSEEDFLEKFEKVSLNNAERIQSNLFLFKSDFEGIENLKKFSDSFLVFEYKAQYKIHPSLYMATWKEPVIIEALLHKREKPESLFTETRKHFFLTLLGDEKKGFRLRWFVEGKEVQEFAKELSKHKEVALVYPWFLPSPLNDDSIWIIQSYDTENKRNYSLSAVMFNHGILGEDEIATVCDTGLDNDMCYFSYNSSDFATAQYPTPPSTGDIDLSKKVIGYSVLPGATAYDNDANCGAFNQYHGTHTSGTLLGDNYSNPSSVTNIGHDFADGMAPMAKLYFQDAGDDVSGCLSGLSIDYSLLFRQSYDAGARIHSNSWGADSGGEYTTDAFSVDDFCYRYDDFVICFAAGNSGYLAQSINSPATAKNCITAGSLTNGSVGSNQVSDFSSKGPTKDGRIKPDLCAPGEYILSASGTSSSSDRNCDFKPLSGTSMATPTLAGGALLLRDYFIKGFYPSGEKNVSDSFNPSSALIKCALAAGAMDVGIKDFPNFNEGFGRINLDRFCYFKQNEKDNLRARICDVRNYAGLKEGEEMTLSFNAKGYIKIVLTWTDPPPSLIALKSLINDLDLKVVSPSGNVYFGNNLQNGISVPQGSPDTQNNIEMFLLENGEEGLWQVKVVGKDIKGSPDYPYSNVQGFALVILKEYEDAPTGTPQITSILDSSNEGIKIEWNLVEGASSYSVYRIDESGEYQGKETFIGETSENYFFDRKVQGGYLYSYYIRPVANGFEGKSSEKQTITYNGNCTLLPQFKGVKEWQNVYSTSSCDITLFWDEAISGCPLASDLSYNIYRESFPNFIPSYSNRIATGVKGISYTDLNAPGDITSYYIVRSEDSTTLNGGPANGGNEDRNLVTINATPQGEEEFVGNLIDNGGDTLAFFKMEEPFTISTLSNHTPNGNYSYSLSKEGEQYPNSTCASLYSPKIRVASQDSELSYYVKYNLEYGWDGVVVEISEDDGVTFFPVTPDENYPSSFFLTGEHPINSCQFPSTQGCFNGPQTNDTLTEWQKYTHSLSPYEGKEIVVRWRFSSDPASEYEGFFLDDIEFKNVYVHKPCISSTPSVSFDKSQYGCNDVALITARCFEKKGTKIINCLFSSDTEVIPETIVLYENPSNSGIFSSSVSTVDEITSGDGKIGVKNGDTISASVECASQSFTTSSLIDCISPQITLLSLGFSNLEVEIYFETSEPTTALIKYGETEDLPKTITDDSLSTSHRIKLSSLSPCTTYFYSITIEDYSKNLYQSEIKSFTTKMCYPAPIIKDIKVLTNPFKLQIIGENFIKDSEILINDNFVPETTFKNSAKLVAKKGNKLKAMVPKGETVSVTVYNSSDMNTSQPFYFTR